MSDKYVSTRIKAVGSAKAVQGIMHDTRFTVPGYLRRDPEAKFHSFKDNVTLMCRGAKNNAIRDFCRETIMDSVREQQEIYKEKIQETYEKLKTGIIEVNKLFENEDCNVLLEDLTKYDKNVKKHYNEYLKTNEIWDKLKSEI